MKCITAFIAVLLLTVLANAQSPVSVIGPITVGNCAQFSSTTIIKDAGVTCGGGGGSGGIVIGTTAVTGAGAGQFLFNSSGVVGAATLGTMSTQNASAVAITGGTIGSVAITGGTITGLGIPVVSSDAANKQYVDNAIVGLIIHSQALLATTAALPTNTYNNGSSGVGATLTATSNGALTVDGVLTTSSNRIVVKNEAAPANNGIYTVTTVGDGSHPYVLTRATDANTPGTSNPAEIGFGTYVFVTSGTANSDTGWSVTSTVTTIGTSAINWAQFSVVGGGGGTPGGSNGQVQFNNAGSFGGLTNTQLSSRVLPGGSSNPITFGADPTGSSDSTTAFNNCVATGACGVPPGTYMVTGCINIGSETSLVGLMDNPFSTRIFSTSTSLGVVCLAAETVDVTVRGLWLDRTVTPVVSTAAGLYAPGHVVGVYAKNLFITNQFEGIVVGLTENSYLTNIQISSSYSHGLLMEPINFESVTGTSAGAGGVIVLQVPSTFIFANVSGYVVTGVGGTTEANGTWAVTVIDPTHISLNGSTWVHAWTSGGTVNEPSNAIQWQVNDVIAAFNNADGFAVICNNANIISSGGGCTMGDWSNIRTFANFNGLVLAGSTGTAISDLVLSNGFFGDGQYDVYVDSYGGSNRFVGITAEGAGETSYGRGGANPPAGSGNGFLISANNLYTQLIGSNINGSANECIVNAGTQTVISGNVITHCGQSGAAVTGFHQIASGNSVFTGNISSNQNFGAVYDSDNPQNVNTGNMYLNNATFPIAPPSLTQTVISGNSPRSVNN